MRFATRLGLAALAFVLAAGSASAQNDVTFQVDLNQYITTCQFDAAANTVLVRGSFNGFDESTALTDSDGNGVYNTTLSLAEGAIEYKFFVGSNTVLSWENDVTNDGGTTNNRDYTVVAGAQTLSAVNFNGPDATDSCNSVEEDYEVTFTVDMSVQVARGAFDPTTQVPGVAGAITDWGSNAVRMQPDAARDNVYSVLIDTTFSGTNVSIPTAGGAPYKFVILNQADNSVAAWESGSDRTITPTGNESDADNDGLQELVLSEKFFNGVDFSQVLEDDQEVTFRVDLNPATFYLRDNGSIPQGAGTDVTEITGLFINGPAAWESTAGGGPGAGITDWIGWGPSDLGNRPAFGFSDADGDNVWELTLTYPAGALKTLVGKLGVNGSDNEANGGNDAFYPILTGTSDDGDGDATTSVIDLVFGAILKQDGTFVDSNGPGGNAIYDPYILVDNTATPPTAMSVDGTGEFDVANERGPGLAEGVTLGAPRPNPAVGRVSFDLGLDRAMDVSVQVIDLMGRTVASIAEGGYASGETELSFDASTLASGVYVLRVQAGGEVVSRRLTVVR